MLVRDSCLGQKRGKTISIKVALPAATFRKIILTMDFSLLVGFLGCCSLTLLLSASLTVLDFVRIRRATSECANRKQQYPILFFGVVEAFLLIVSIVLLAMTLSTNRQERSLKTSLFGTLEFCTGVNVRSQIWWMKRLLRLYSLQESFVTSLLLLGRLLQSTQPLRCIQPWIWYTMRGITNHLVSRQF